MLEKEHISMLTKISIRSKCSQGYYYSLMDRATKTGYILLQVYNVKLYRLWAHKQTDRPQVLFSFQIDKALPSALINHMYKTLTRCPLNQLSTKRLMVPNWPKDMIFSTFLKCADNLKLAEKPLGAWSHKCKDNSTISVYLNNLPSFPQY